MGRTERLGSFLLEQPEGVFPLGEDTLALGRFATVRRGWRVCDLGCGSGALLLLLAGRERELSLTGIDLDPRAVRACQGNLQANGLTGSALPGDLCAPPFPAGSFDLVISNPPYFALGRGGSAGAQRSEERCTQRQLCAAAARLTRNGGRFALCCRPERLAELMCARRGHGLEPKRLQLLAHTPASPPSAALGEAVRQGRPGLEVLPGLFHTG